MSQEITIQLFEIHSEKQLIVQEIQRNPEKIDIENINRLRSLIEEEMILETQLDLESAV